MHTISSKEIVSPRINNPRKAVQNGAVFTVTVQIKIGILLTERVRHAYPMLPSTDLATKNFP